MNPLEKYFEEEKYSSEDALQRMGELMHQLQEIDLILLPRASVQKEQSVHDIHALRNDFDKNIIELSRFFEAHAPEDATIEHRFSSWRDAAKVLQTLIEVFESKTDLAEEELRIWEKAKISFTKTTAVLQEAITPDGNEDSHGFPSLHQN